VHAYCFVAPSGLHFEPLHTMARSTVPQVLWAWSLMLGKCWPVDFVWSTWPILHVVWLLFSRRSEDNVSLQDATVLGMVTLWVSSITRLLHLLKPASPLPHHLHGVYGHYHRWHWHSLLLQHRSIPQTIITPLASVHPLPLSPCDCPYREYG